jgi:hypothetical protein
VTLTELVLEHGDELVVVTANSIWRIRPDAYHREPRGPDLGGRHPDCLDDGLDDGRWHPHAGAWWAADAKGTRVRLLPQGRPSGAFGILTGDIERIGDADGCGR